MLTRSHPHTHLKHDAVLGLGVVVIGKEGHHQHPGQQQQVGQEGPALIPSSIASAAALALLNRPGLGGGDRRRKKRVSIRVRSPWIYIHVLAQSQAHQVPPPLHMTRGELTYISLRLALGRQTTCLAACCHSLSGGCHLGLDR